MLNKLNALYNITFHVVHCINVSTLLSVIYTVVLVTCRFVDRSIQHNKNFVNSFFHIKATNVDMTGCSQILQTINIHVLDSRYKQYAYHMGFSYAHLDSHTIQPELCICMYITLSHIFNATYSYLTILFKKTGYCSKNWKLFMTCT